MSITNRMIEAAESVYRIPGHKYRGTDLAMMKKLVREGLADNLGYNEFELTNRGLALIGYNPTKRLFVLVDDLLAKLPHCEKHPYRPATKLAPVPYGRNDCDECATEQPREDCNYAEALRALMKVVRK